MISSVNAVVSDTGEAAGIFRFLNTFYFHIFSTCGQFYTYVNRCHFAIRCVNVHTNALGVEKEQKEGSGRKKGNRGEKRQKQLSAAQIPASLLSLPAVFSLFSRLRTRS